MSNLVGIPWSAKPKLSVFKSYYFDTIMTICVLFLGLGIAQISRIAVAPTYGPSRRALALQSEINESIHTPGISNVSISPGDYYFGNASLVIEGATNFTLHARAGPGTVQLWFSIGAGLLVNQSSDVVLDGLSLDYDPPAHYQGTIVKIIDSNNSDIIQAIVKTDQGFLDPVTFDATYRMGMPGVLSGPAALVWNSSDPGFGAFASVSWPPTVTARTEYIFDLSRSRLCGSPQSVMTDGTSCLVRGAEPQPQDKITAHIRKGYTLHILNSTRVHSRHCSIHGAPGFAITEYDGYGGHSYFNVSVGRRQPLPDEGRHPTDAVCGTSNPTGGRLCFGLIASNNDALHSSGCKYGPSFTQGVLSYCLDDWVNIHSRAQVVFNRTDARHIIIIDPRLTSAASAPDDFPYGNVETLTNAREGDAISFFLSGNLSLLGSARVHSLDRLSWDRDAALVDSTQKLLDTTFAASCGLDAGTHCRPYGCEPRVWRVTFNSDIPAWGAAESATGVVATLDSWGASRGVIRDSHLHHGRFGIRWKSSDGVMSGNRVSARYIEISPLEYYMEGPFRLNNITVARNAFPECSAPAPLFPKTTCTNDSLPLGYWTRWTKYGGGTGGVCKAAAVGASHLVTGACTDVNIAHNKG